MDRQLPKSLREALSELKEIDWDFEDEDPSRESDESDWNAHLAMMLNHEHRASDLDEKYEHARWLRSQFMHRHLDEFGQLLDAASNYFFELTQASGQLILGERAGLERLEPSQRPHGKILFRHQYPPEDPPLWDAEYEKAVGGPHVLGARLIWWCAAAKAPELFGYTLDFSQQVWTEPIWTIMKGGKAKANPRPVDLIVRTASKVCQILTTSETDLESEPSRSLPKPDGPDRESRRFWWKNQSVELRLRSWQLLDLVWRNGGNVAVQDAVDEVWQRHIKDSTVSNAIWRVNDQLPEDWVLRLHSSDGFIRLYHRDEQVALKLPRNGIA